MAQRCERCTRGEPGSGSANNGATGKVASWHHHPWNRQHPMRPPFDAAAKKKFRDKFLAALKKKENKTIQLLRKNLTK